MIGIVILLLLLLACAFGLYCLTDIKPSTSPIVAITLLLNINIIFSLFNLLKAGTYFCLAMCMAIFIAGILRIKRKTGNPLRKFFTPSLMFLIVSVRFVLISLYRTQPVFSQWDEFSFWGIASKQTYNHNAIYTFYKTSMLGTSTPPALPVLTYIFMTVYGSYCEWVAFFSYDVLILSCITAFSGFFDEENRHLSRVVSISGIALIYFFSNISYTDYVSRTFISAYADLPLGVLFAAAIAVYLTQTEKGTSGTLSTISLIITLTFTKDMGFALSCIVAFILFFDSLSDNRDFRLFVFSGNPAKVLSAGTVLAATLASYIGWSVHMSRVVLLDRTQLGGEAELSMMGLLVEGIKGLLFPSARSEKFTIVFGNMLRAFFSVRVCALGTGFVLCIFITLIFALSFAIAEKDRKINILTAFITSCIGFIGYYVFHIFLYVYVFRDEGYTLASYSRYMAIYYIGWLSISIMMLSSAVRKEKEYSQAFITILTFAMVMIFMRYVKRDNMFFSADRNTFADRYNVTQKVEYLSDVIDKDDVIWVYSGGNAGAKWFIYTYELSDNIIVSDYFAERNSGASEEENRKIIQKTMTEFFRKNGVTNVLIDYGSEEIETMSEMFDENPGQWGLVSAGYYKVNYTDDGMTINLVKGGDVLG